MVDDTLHFAITYLLDSDLSIGIALSALYTTGPWCGTKESWKAHTSHISQLFLLSVFIMNCFSYWKTFDNKNEG